MSTNENNGNLLDPHSKSGVKAARAKQQELEEKKKSTRNKILGGISAVLITGLVLYNQGVFTEENPAISISGVNYSTSQVELFYTDGIYSALMGQTLPAEGGEAYDMSVPADDQVYSFNPYLSWHDYFVQEAVNTLGEMHLISDLARADGFTLPEEGLAQLAASEFSLETSWIGYYPNQKSFLQGQYGPSMTKEIYLDMIERELLANYYQTEMYENFSYTDGELETYYQENSDDFDMVTFTQFHFTTTPLELAVDEETGEEAEATTEQIEGFNAEKEAKGVLAEELQNALVDGATLDEVVAQFEDLYSSYVPSDTWLSSGLSSSTYGAWLLEEDRVYLDSYQSGAGVGYSATYTVTVYESRERADEVTANIRHIYIAANEEGVPTEDEWAEAETRAEEMLAQWIADGSDVEAFGALAEEHSADAGSAANAGILEDVTTMSGYVDTFTNWATDTNRKAGDTGIVKNEGSAVQGWHIMYFESWGDPMWKIGAENGAKTVSMEEWRENIFADMETAIIQLGGYDDIKAVSLF